MKTSMNERTCFFIKIYLSHFIIERVDVSTVWEVSWRLGKTATHWLQVLLTIAALPSHSGWAAQPWVTEGPSPLSGAGSHSAGILFPTGTATAWLPQAVCGTWLYNCHLLPVGVRIPNSTTFTGQGNIPISSTGCTSFAVIYTGASLDWRLGRESICYIPISVHVCFYFSLSWLRDLFLKYCLHLFCQHTCLSRQHPTSWCNCLNAELRNRCKRALTPNTLFHSLSDKYILARYEAPIFPSTVLLDFQTQFLPSSSRIDIAVWVHHLDANKKARKEARRQLHKDVGSSIKKDLAPTPHKASTMRPLISHHENYPS